MSETTIITENNRDSQSLHTLANKVSGACYALALVVGLSVLVLNIQQPVVTTQDLYTTTLPETVARDLVANADKEIERVFRSRLDGISYPYSAAVDEYLSTGEVQKKAQALNRFLLEESSEKSRHRQMILGIKAANDVIRKHVAAEFRTSGSVTVPILQSRISGGDFALCVVVLFVALHAYALGHRDYHNHLCRALGNERVPFVASLLLATDRDLATFPGRREGGYRLVQVGCFFGLPFLLVLSLGIHLWQAEVPLVNQKRILFALAMAVIWTWAAWRVWFRAPEGKNLERGWSLFNQLPDDVKAQAGRRG